MDFFRLNGLFVLFVVITQALLPQQSLGQSVVSNETLSSLSEHPTWQGLLHYVGVGFHTNVVSQVDDDAFFIASNGDTDALAELSATLAVFQSPKHPEFLTRACQFPARFHWLQQRLGTLPQMPRCTEFEAFERSINVEKVFVVFPAAYLNSPSSMFGHTFLRLRAAHRNNPLLDYAVNFAADANASENTIIYSIKGLAGGYPGRFSVVPYYDKIKEYSFLDSRDIWEYELALSSEEQAQLVRHVWELQNIQFDYYFLTENCSYRLVTLLGAISEKIDVEREYLFRAVPTDTLRFLSQALGFKAIQYRPSQVTQLRFARSQFSDATLTDIREVIEGVKEPKDLLDSSDPVATLDLAYDYARYVAAKEKRNIPKLSDRTLELLSLRAKQAQTREPPKPPAPLTRDDEGHQTLAFTTAAGHNQFGDFLDLQIRGAYHDLLDSPEGYPKNAQLELFNLHLRHGIDDSRTVLQRLAFVNIVSNTPVDSLVRPKSWLVGFGFAFDPFKETHKGYIDGGVGRTWSLDQIDVSLLATSSFHVFTNTASLGAGPLLQAHYQSSRWSFLAKTQWHGMINREFDILTSTSLGVAKHFDGWQLRVSLEHEASNRSDTLGGQLGLRFYVDN